MRSLRPLVSRSTYRGWAWLILGGALLMPYMMAGEVVRIATFGSPEPFSMLAIEPAVFAAVLPAIALTALALPVRALSVLTARSLLGADVPDVAGARGWSRRWRDAAWFTVHLGVGGVLSGVTLALVPFLVLVALLPFVRDPQTASGELLSVGWPLWLGPLGAPLALAALVYAVWATTRATRWCAPKLLGPSAAEQLAASRAEATRLAARNRIARELHDSVGHALSVVTVQAAAAGRVLDSDPEFARKALGAVEETARRALDDLDQVLGVLRADAGDAAPRHGLEDLPSLLESCGLDVEARHDVDLSRVPAVLSRESYRIVQESLTNALRYGADGTARLRLARDEASLHIDVDNPIPAAARPARRGSGIAGLVERADVLGGELTAGPVDGRWRVSAILPLTSQP